MRVGAAIGMCLLLLWAQAAHGVSPGIGFSVRYVDSKLNGETWVLNAGIDLEFNLESRKALESGVPLTVLLEIEVVRERLFRDKLVRRIRTPYRIERHALSQRYVITHLPSGRTRTYGAIADAGTLLDEIDGLTLIEHAELRPGHTHRVRLRARLDIEAMPSPLRPLARILSVWGSHNRWFSWVLPS